MDTGRCRIHCTCGSAATSSCTAPATYRNKPGRRSVRFCAWMSSNRLPANRKQLPAALTRPRNTFQPSFFYHGRHIGIGGLFSEPPYFSRLCQVPDRLGYLSGVDFGLIVQYADKIVQTGFDLCRSATHTLSFPVGLRPIKAYCETRNNGSKPLYCSFRNVQNESPSFAFAHLYAQVSMHWTAFYCAHADPSGSEVKCARRMGNIFEDRVPLRDLSLRESSATDDLNQVCFQQPPCDSAGPQRYVVQSLAGHSFLNGDIPDE